MGGATRLSNIYLIDQIRGVQKGCLFEGSSLGCVRSSLRCGTFRRFFFSFLVGILDCRGFLGKKIKRAFEISKNKCAFFLVFLYSRHKPTSI